MSSLSTIWKTRSPPLHDPHQLTFKGYREGIPMGEGGGGTHHYHNRQLPIGGPVRDTC
jgi:hypothetical protein